MSLTTLAPLESTVHTTNLWLKELMEAMGREDPHRAYQALRAVLHALRDRLTVAETADLGAQLPMLIRGLYYEGWSPSGKPLRERKREHFLAHIAAAFRDAPEVFPEDIARSVFRLLQRHVSPGEIGDVQQILPAEIRSLWPGSDVRHGT
jgi:uncharacterized protein (DUF2267 family)